MGFFEKLKGSLYQALEYEYENYLIVQFPANETTTLSGLKYSIVSKYDFENQSLDTTPLYIVDTGEGLKEGYFTTVYLKEGYLPAPNYYKNKYDFKKQRWTEEPFLSGDSWTKSHLEDRFIITSDKQEAQRLVKTHCFEAWKDGYKRKKK